MEKKTEHFNANFVNNSQNLANLVELKNTVIQMDYLKPLRCSSQPRIIIGKL